MKVNKKGEPKLEKGEVRIGNFFVKEEPEHIKIQDLNTVFTHRIRKETAIGIWVGNMLKQGEGGLASLRTYIGTLWSVFSPAPDNEFIEALLKDTSECIHRHPEWYGGKKEEVSDEEDQKIIEEQREMAEFVEQVKNMGDGDSEARE